MDEPPTESVVEEVTYRHLLPAAGRPLQALGLDEYVSLTARMLAGLVAAERPALLHVSSGHRGFESALAGNAVARWAGIPWLYEVRSFFETTWTDDPRYAERGEYYERRFATETRMMAAADGGHPVRSDARGGHPRHGFPPRRSGGPQRRRRHPLRTPGPRPRPAAHARVDRQFTLGYVSNLSHRREGQEVLIEAVAKLREAGRAVTGLLVGDGNRRAELERLARKLGVARHVVFTGNVPFDEVAGHYAQIDLFVVPRVDDRAARMVSPLKPFEAMAMGVPLLVADLPALIEITGAGARGHRSPPGTGRVGGRGRPPDGPRARTQPMADAAAPGWPRNGPGPRWRTRSERCTTNFRAHPPAASRCDRPDGSSAC